MYTYRQMILGVASTSDRGPCSKRQPDDWRFKAVNFVARLALLQTAEPASQTQMLWCNFLKSWWSRACQAKACQAKACQGPFVATLDGRMCVCSSLRGLSQSGSDYLVLFHHVPSAWAHTDMWGSESFLNQGRLWAATLSGGIIPLFVLRITTAVRFWRGISTPRNCLFRSYFLARRIWIKYFEVGDVCDSHFKKNPSSTSSRDNGRTTQEAVWIQFGQQLCFCCLGRVKWAQMALISRAYSSVIKHRWLGKLSTNDSQWVIFHCRGCLGGYPTPSLHLCPLA